MDDQELIKRLRHGEGWPITAADRIEELVKERDEAEKNETLCSDMAVRYFERAETAEAKLAKAAEALREIKAGIVTDSISIGEIEYDIRVVLAELEGK